MPSLLEHSERATRLSFFEAHARQRPDGDLGLVAALARLPLVLSLLLLDVLASEVSFGGKSVMASTTDDDVRCVIAAA